MQTQLLRSSHTGYIAEVDRHQRVLTSYAMFLRFSPYLSPAHVCDHEGSALTASPIQAVCRRTSLAFEQVRPHLCYQANATHTGIGLKLLQCTWYPSPTKTGWASSRHMMLMDSPKWKTIHVCARVYTNEWYEREFHYLSFHVRVNRLLRDFLQT